MQKFGDKCRAEAAPNPPKGLSECCMDPDDIPPARPQPDRRDQPGIIIIVGGVDVDIDDPNQPGIAGVDVDIDDEDNPNVPDELV